MNLKVKYLFPNIPELISREVMTIEPLERIAQLVVCPIFKPAIVKADSLTPTERGARGFGSTGKD